MRRNYSGLSMDRELIRDVSRESLSRDKEMRTDARGRDRDRMQRYSNDRNRRYEAEEPEWFSGWYKRCLGEFIVVVIKNFIRT